MNKKKKRLIFSLSIVACFAIAFAIIKLPKSFAAQKLSSNSTGTEDGYNYELWKDNGNTSMTLNGGGKFSCEWSNIGNALFRKGKKFDSNKTYQQIGNISVKYACDYNPSGNSYLCVYGWTKNPLVEYYIVDSWGTWRPPGSSSKGTINIDGGTYDVYETTRVNQPSIEGNTTFKQYWSVRTSKRTSGTISVTEHFKAWEKLGMTMGKMYETALTVEGYQSSGKANVTENTITIGGSSTSSSSNSKSSSNSSSSNNNNTSNNNNSNKNNNDNSSKKANNASKVECETMSLSGQYAGKISSPFNGVALYANNDTCSYTRNFTSSTSNFSLRGCSNNSSMARVDLKIGGEKKGTFYYGGNSPAVYTLKNIKHKTGNQKVELVVTSDNGSWDAYLDYLEIK